MNYPDKRVEGDRSSRRWRVEFHSAPAEAVRPALCRVLQDAVAVVRAEAFNGLQRDLSAFQCVVRLESVSSESLASELTIEFCLGGVIGDDELIATWTALRVLHAIHPIKLLEGHRPDEWFPMGDFRSPRTIR